MNKMLIIAVVVALAVGISIGAAFFFLAQEQPETAAVDEPVDVQAKAIYHNLRPPFILTRPVGPMTRTIQADLVVMSRDQQAIEAVLRHMPLLRHKIVEYLTDLDMTTMERPDGKQNMLAELVGVFNDTLASQSEDAEVETVLLNNFVMQ